MSSLPLPALHETPKLTLASDAESNASSMPALDESYFDQIAQLVRLAKPARKAAGYAMFSGWATLLGGTVSLPFALGNPSMLLLCVVLAWIGTRELTLRRKLLQLETSAPKKLAFNQIALGITLASYAIYMLMQPSGESIVGSSIASDPMLQGAPEIAGIVEDMTQLEQMIMAGVYALLIVIAMVVQGGTAGYYALKTRSLRKLHKQTPEWCIRVYRAANAG
jgi:hypothetical protein